MKKVISYRQKLIELARIYKIFRILDVNLKLTTYEIELELLKNKVPIPSRRGYFSHKIVNEILNPFVMQLKDILTIDFKLYKNFKNQFNKIGNSIKRNLSIYLNLNQISKIMHNKINNFFNFIFSSINISFNFVISNINNFFKVLTKTVINSLNDIYHFQYEEKFVKKIILRGVYSFFLVMLVSGGFYVKSLITDVDGLKISLEIKKDKIKTVKKPEVAKKKEPKKLDTPKEPYNPETDYKLNTQTVLNLFEDLEYDLDYVRKKKLVKPIYFTRLPKDLDSLRSTSRKKETFLQILLPLVVAENERIEKDRKYLLKILKENESPKKTNWINKKYKEYRVSKKI